MNTFASPYASTPSRNRNSGNDKLYANDDDDDDDDDEDDVREDDRRSTRLAGGLTRHATLQSLIYVL